MERVVLRFARWTVVLVLVLGIVPGHGRATAGPGGSQARRTGWKELSGLSPAGRWMRRAVLLARVGRCRESIGLLHRLSAPRAVVLRREWILWAVDASWLCHDTKGLVEWLRRLGDSLPDWRVASWRRGEAWARALLHAGRWRGAARWFLERGRRGVFGGHGGAKGVRAEALARGLEVLVMQGRPRQVLGLLQEVPRSMWARAEVRIVAAAAYLVEGWQGRADELLEALCGRITLQELDALAGLGERCGGRALYEAALDASCGCSQVHPDVGVRCPYREPLRRFRRFVGRRKEGKLCPYMESLYGPVGARRPRPGPRRRLAVQE